MIRRRGQGWLMMVDLTLQSAVHERPQSAPIPAVPWDVG